MSVLENAIRSVARVTFVPVPRDIEPKDLTVSVDGARLDKALWDWDPYRHGVQLDLARPDGDVSLEFSDAQ